MCHVDESTLSGHNGGMEVSELARTVKENILRILAEQGVSKNELSRRTGIDQSALVKVLNGDRELQTDTIQKIADALSVRSSDLIVEHEHAA
jgi:DNA-binding Xre family transcriptional regulator